MKQLLHELPNPVDLRRWIAAAVTLCLLHAAGSRGDTLQLTADTTLTTGGTGVLDLGATTVFSGTMPGESYNLSIVESGATVALGEFTNTDGVTTGDYVNILNVNVGSGTLAMMGDIITNGDQFYRADGGISLAGIYGSRLDGDIRFGDLTNSTNITLTGDTEFRTSGFLPNPVGEVRFHGAARIDGPYRLIVDANFFGGGEADVQAERTAIGGLVPLASVDFRGDDVELLSVSTVGPQIYTASDEVDGAGLLQTQGANIVIGSMEDFEMHANTTLDTHVGVGGDAGDITVTSANTSNTSLAGNTDQYDLTFDASSNGGDGGMITLGQIGNMHHNRVNLFFDDVTIKTSGTGRVVLNSDVATDGDLVLAAPAGIVPGGLLTSNLGNVSVDGRLEVQGVTTISSAGITSLDGVLALDVGGTDPANIDRLVLVGGASLGSIVLTVTLTNEFVPQLGQSFDVLDFAGLAGNFDGFQLPNLGLTRRWDTTNLLVDGSLSVIARIPGDYDENGVVEPNDYTVWKNNFGSTTALAVDGNGNGIVDAADYTVWRDHLNSSGGMAAASVPETGSLILLLFGAAAALGRRSRAGQRCGRQEVLQSAGGHLRRGG